MRRDDLVKPDLPSSSMAMVVDLAMIVVTGFTRAAAVR